MFFKKLLQLSLLHWLLNFLQHTNLNYIISINLMFCPYLSWNNFFSYLPMGFAICIYIQIYLLVHICICINLYIHSYYDNCLLTLFLFYRPVVMRNFPKTKYVFIKLGKVTDLLLVKGFLRPYEFIFFYSRFKWIIVSFRSVFS